MDIGSQNTTAWLSTTASQIFFMQLGFLCYEVGYVKRVWTESIILKNIEDTFVGILTYLAFGYTLSESPHSVYGIISIPTNPLLIGIDASDHNSILISAFFATTCATIISGAVLERMKNKAYIAWCLLTILINYSFVSHWVWHPDGWLSKLGFVDGAGAVVVHSTAGMSALVAIWKLGPRQESVDVNGNLLPTEHASNPVINATGAFFLWYGWFAFNVSSPIAYHKGIGDAVGTTALVTVISPITASCAAFVWMHFGYVKLSFESLLSCLLGGLVSVTGMCHTCDVWCATVIGVLSSIVYFVSARLIRLKWKIDDPLDVVAIHFFCGVFSCIVEGVVANDTYDSPGIIYSGTFEHFGVQLLGVVAIIAFNFLMSLFLYEILLKGIIFRRIDIRVSILDIYLGTKLFDQNYDMALDEVLNCDSPTAKQMLWEFHHYLEDRYASEQLDFLIVTKIYNHYLQRNEAIDWKSDKYQSAKYILRIFSTYIDENSDRCINVSGKQRSIVTKIKHQLLFEIKSDRIQREQNENEKENKMEKEKDDEEYKYNTLNKSYLTKFESGSGLDITKENVFKAVYGSVWKLIIPHFTEFLSNCYDIEKQTKFDIKIPFELERNWCITWDKVVSKASISAHLADTLPKYNNSGTLLSKMLNEYDGKQSAQKKQSETGLNQIQLVDYDDPILIVDGSKELQTNKATVIIQ